MANQSPIQQTTLDDYPLFTEESDSVWASAPYSGQWFPIRITPDLATGELLNIGVGFIDDSGEIHTRLLTNAKALGYMYGKRGEESFGFLINLVDEHFSISNQYVSPSPQIVLGELSYASGDNYDQILNSLFKSMVSLTTDDDHADKLNLKNAINNKELRKVFSKLMSQIAPRQHKNYFRNSPVDLKDPSGRHIEVDLQLWSEQGSWIDRAVPFGSIVSAHYLEKVYRGCNLGNGCQDMINAATILSDSSQGYLGILKPGDNSQGFSKSEIHTIENEIDKTVWAITKHHKNIVIGVESEISKLVHESVNTLFKG